MPSQSESFCRAMPCHVRCVLARLREMFQQTRLCDVRMPAGIYDAPQHRSVTCAAVCAVAEATAVPGGGTAGGSAGGADSREGRCPRSRRLRPTCPAGKTFHMLLISLVSANVGCKIPAEIFIKLEISRAGAARRLAGRTVHSFAFHSCLCLFCVGFLR